MSKHSYSAVKSKSARNLEREKRKCVLTRERETRRIKRGMERHRERETSARERERAERRREEQEKAEDTQADAKGRGHVDMCACVFGERVLVCASV